MASGVSGVVKWVGVLAGIAAVAGAALLSNRQGVSRPVASTCPASVQTALMGINAPQDGRDTHLVPVLPVPRGPVSALVCQYGDDAKPKQAVKLDAARAAEFAGVVDDPAAAAPRENASLNTANSDLLVIFTYPTGGTSVLLVTSGGIVTNTVLRSSQRGDVFDELDRLLD